MATKIEEARNLLLDVLNEEKIPLSGMTFFINPENTFFSEMYIFEDKKRYFRPKAYKSDKIKIPFPYAVNSRVIRGREVSERIGLYKVEVKSGKHLFHCYVHSFLYGFRNDVVDILCCTGEQFKIINKISTECRAFNNSIRIKSFEDDVPKFGIWRAHFSMITNNQESKLTYKRKYLKDMFSGEIIHPQKDEIMADIDEFFTDLDGPKMYLRWGMPGIRNVMLIGEPGTGKTSMMNIISKVHRKTTSFVYCKNIDQLYAHIKNCDKHGVRTIAFYDDCETQLRDTGQILDFLDGEDKPLSKQGAYVIFATNRPEVIDERIIKRPGRIDKIFVINYLEGEDSIKCANQYYKGLAKFDDDCKLFDKMTGAQIKASVSFVLKYVVGKKIELTADTVKMALNEMKNNYRMIGESRKSSSTSNLTQNNNPIGFDLE